MNKREKTILDREKVLTCITENYGICRSQIVDKTGIPQSSACRYITYHFEQKHIVITHYEKYGSNTIAYYAVAGAKRQGKSTQNTSRQDMVRMPWVAV